jgi:putative nucleotidyltransferase with HDIG domain
MSVLEKMIDTQEFATLPPVATRILKLLENDNIDFRDIARIVETDATLTLKLLKVANSPLYATRTEVASVQQAIVTLGLNRLTNIVLGISIFSRFFLSSQKQAADLIQKFWWHSSCTGMVAKSLALKINRFFKENEFIGGLLHDIGKLAMLQYDAAKYHEVIKLTIEEKILDVDAERKVFELDHIEVGTYIATVWKLPEDLASIISGHNSLSALTSNRELVSIVRFADVLCEIWGADMYEGLKNVNLSSEESWRILSSSYPELKEFDLEAFTFELEQDFKNASTFLNLITHETD